MAVHFDRDVQITQLGPSQRAAEIDSLAAHLLLDVEALDGRRELVHYVDHSSDGVGVRAFAEILVDAHQTDAELFELVLHDGGFVAVAEYPRAHVDDDVLDIAVRRDVCPEVLEHRPLLDGELGCGVARLDEELDHLCAQGDGFSLGASALGADGQPVRVSIHRSAKLPLA
nr:hypothetical protein [Nocardia nova]